MQWKSQHNFVTVCIEITNLTQSSELYDIEISIASYMNIKIYFEENLTNVTKKKTQDDKEIAQTVSNGCSACILSETYLTTKKLPY